MDLIVGEKALEALQQLAGRGGSLPGKILSNLCFSSSSACTKTMGQLAKIDLVEKGKYQCYSKTVNTSVYYVLTRDALGLVTGKVWPQWLAEAGMRRFNLACQELRYILECDGWRWMGSPREILIEMKRRGVTWATFDGRLPLLAMMKDRQLCLFWVFWQGLPEGEMRAWEQTTRELRQRDLLIGVALKEEVARDIRKRCKKTAIRCWICSIEEFTPPPTALGQSSC